MILLNTWFILYELLGTKIKTIFTVSLAAVIVSMVAGNSMAYADFSGSYDPANWAFTDNGGDGSVDTSSAPVSIELTGSNLFGNVELDPPFIPTDTDFTITVPCDTTISFDWDYDTVDVPFPFDSASYFVGAAVTQLADQPDNNSVGAVAVLTGETFGFRVHTNDNTFGPGVLTITNFDAGDPCAETDIQVDVDIKVGSDPNCVNTKSKGSIPVAILGSADFDVTDIDQSTLKIDPVLPIKFSIKDANGDGFDDLNLKFKTQQLFNAGLLVDDNELVVTGALNDATPISGSDFINLAGGPNCFD